VIMHCTLSFNLWASVSL